MKKINFKNNIKGLLALSFAVAVFPLVSFAQTKDLAYLAALFVKYLNIAIELIIALAVITFIFNVYRYFFTEKSSKADAGMYVLYSVIGFFVILSFWGLVAILSNTFALPNTRPQFPFGGSQNNGGGTVIPRM